jgi:hypothetical protein
MEHYCIFSKANDTQVFVGLERLITSSEMMSPSSAKCMLCGTWYCSTTYHSWMNLPECRSRWIISTCTFLLPTRTSRVSSHPSPNWQYHIPLDESLELLVHSTNWHGCKDFKIGHSRLDQFLESIGQYLLNIRHGTAIANQRTTAIFPVFLEYKMPYDVDCWVKEDWSEQCGTMTSCERSWTMTSRECSYEEFSLGSEQCCTKRSLFSRLLSASTSLDSFKVC